MSLDDILSAVAWPEDTYTVGRRTWRIRGISLSDPAFIGYVFAPYYSDDPDEEERNLAAAVRLITGESRGRVTEEQAKRIAKAAGLARRPAAEIPARENISRQHAAAIIMGTLEDDGTNAFGWAPGRAIPRAAADRLRSAVPTNDLASWADAIFALSIGTITEEAIEEGKAFSDDAET